MYSQHITLRLTFCVSFNFQPPADRYVASILKGLPVSTVLNCGIELWRNLEIDDDELMGTFHCLQHVRQFKCHATH